MELTRNKILVFILILIVFCACQNDECCCPGGLTGKWEAVQFVSVEDADYPKLNDYNPTITFKTDGSLEIQLDVNACFGTYQTGSENIIQVSEVGCTEACCDSNFSQKFTEMLPLVGSYGIEGNVLKLYVSAWGWIELHYLSE